MSLCRMTGLSAWMGFFQLCVLTNEMDASHWLLSSRNIAGVIEGSNFYDFIRLRLSIHSVATGCCIEQGLPIISL